MVKLSIRYGVGFIPGWLINLNVNSLHSLVSFNDNRFLVCLLCSFFLWSVHQFYPHYATVWDIVIIKSSPTFSLALHNLSCNWNHRNKRKWKPYVKLQGLASSTSDMHICKPCFKLNVFLFLLLKNSRHDDALIVTVELQTL